MSVGKTMMAIGVGFALASSAAHACGEATDPEMFGALQIGRIKAGSGRVHFYDPTCDAGKKGPAACRRAAYVMPGDIVLIGDVHDASACAIYVDKGGRTTEGLIGNDRVESVPGTDKVSRQAFVGRWVRTEAEISVAARGADLVFTGDATYGAKDPNRVARGAVNSGDFSFGASPRKNRIAVGIGGADGATAVEKSKAAATDCQLDMIARGPYLVVMDNMQCGGANVSFTGIYRKR